MFKKNLIFIIIFLFLLSFIYPVFASNDTAFVWSEISSPTIETVASLNQDKR